MRTNFTSIQMALSNLVEAMHDVRNQLFAAANVERENLLAAYRNLNDNYADLCELSALALDTANTLEVFADGIDEASESIAGVLMGEDVPKCSFENFVGFCDTCGATITKGSNFTIANDWYECEACATAGETEETEDEDETEDGEQITIDLAETVTENA